MEHTPVLIDEIVSIMRKNQENNDFSSKSYVIDCTFGAGGYSSRILDEFPTLSVIAIDRDLNASIFAKNLKDKYKERFHFINARFSNILQVIKELNVDLSSIQYVVYDLGVSSMQIDSDKGFSFSKDDFLDMRMGMSDLTAFDVVNKYSEEDLSDIIYYFADEIKAKIIAKSICFERKRQPISSTKHLSEIISKIVKHDRINPSTRTFQAIRMEVNKELQQIVDSISSIADKILSNACLLCVSFHSVEDIIVKNIFKYLTGKNIILNNIPKLFYKYFNHFENLSDKNFIIKGSKTFQYFQKDIILPSYEEIVKNPRSRSAKLRVIKKI